MPNQENSTVENLYKKSDRNIKLNVLGQPITECSCDPMTGWYRDGTCSTSDEDLGHHVICCEVTEAFLEFSLSRGNDLVTPRPEFGFQGLQAKDHWCLCAKRWLEAYEAAVIAPVCLQATHQSALEVVPLDVLKEVATDNHLASH